MHGLEGFFGSLGSCFVGADGFSGFGGAKVCCGSFLEDEFLRVDLD